MNKVLLNKTDLEKSASLLRAIAHPLRLKIMKFIHENESVNVNKIYNTLKLEQSITSQHLKILREADLVRTNREGKFIYYSLDYDTIKNLKVSIDNFFES